MKIERYVPKDPNQALKIYNNIYVKNFSPEWTDEKLMELFGKYGTIKSLVKQESPSKKDGEVRPFAFVCYEKEGDMSYGRTCANNAVADLHDQEIEGLKLYVQPAIPSEERQAQIKREQFRFKLSKKKCNLFFKNFPAHFKQENILEIFSPYGEVESIKILSNPESAGDKPRGLMGFVCFKQFDQASNARNNLHNKNLLGV